MWKIVSDVLGKTVAKILWVWPGKVEKEELACRCLVSAIEGFHSHACDVAGQLTQKA